MPTTYKIIHYNKMINRSIADKRFDVSVRYMLMLHKLERKDRVGIGSYRLRNA